MNNFSFSNSKSLTILSLILLVVGVVCIGNFSCCEKKAKTTTQQFTLQIKKIGMGTIVANWAGGSAVDTQLAAGVKVNKNTIVTLTATPPKEKFFVLWNNDTSKTYKVTMNQDQEIKVSFTAMPIVAHTNKRKQIDTSTHKQTYTNKRKQTDTSTRKQTYTNKRKQIDTSTRKQTYTNKRKQTDTSTHKQTYTNKRKQTDTSTHKQMYTNNRKQTDTSTHKQVFHAYTSTASTTNTTTLAVDSSAGFVFTDNESGTYTLTQYIGNSTTITIPSTYKKKPVTSIGEGAFYNCDKLTNITIPNSITNIGSNAFSSCIGLTSITIPNGVTAIQNNTFSFCTGLTSITLPNSITNIGDNVFSSCTGLPNIVLPNSIISIGESAFSSCTGLTNITIENGVNSIGAYAFSACTQLANITIPNSVKTIGKAAFRDCSGLTDIQVDKENTNYVSLNGVLFNKLQTTLIAYPINKTGSYTIPNGVTSIGSNAFAASIGLKNVIFSNSVTSIGSNAFAGCIGLTNITIGNNVTNIGENAFAGCSGLTSVILPSSVTNIDIYAFSDCSSLASITIQATNPPTLVTDNNPFENTNASLLIKVPKASLGAYTISTGWSDYSSKIVSLK